MVHNDYSAEVPPVVEIFADRISITSYGGLVSGLSRDEFLAGRSMPRNRELMRVFRDLDLVEQLGSGVHRILSVYDASVFHISEHFFETRFPLEAEASEVTPQVTPQVEALLARIEGEMTRQAIQDALGLTDREHFRKAYLAPALEQGVIEMTLPGKPRSRLQKYRLSAAGRRMQGND